LKLGQIVRYREWRPGDTPIENVDPLSRGWGRSGIVIRICDWTEQGKIEKGKGIEYLDSGGAIILAHKKDLIEIRTEVGSD
jgi:hypothetical protein